jgi:hypothetical protein
VDFEFSPQEQAFAEEVDKWLVDNHDPVVMASSPPRAGSG